MTVVFLTSASTSPWSKPGDWADAGHQIELVGCGGISGAGSTGTSGRGGGGGGGGAYTELDYSSGALSATTAFYVGINTALTTNVVSTKWGSSSAAALTNSYYAENGRAGSTVTAGAGGSGTTVSNGTPPTPVYTKTVGRNGGSGGAAAAVIGGGGGGGGAAGPAANGGTGGAGGTTAGWGGGGGGAANNASNGVASTSATGGGGGTGVGPSTGGGAGSSTTTSGNGSAGIGGKGGGGGCGSTATAGTLAEFGYAGGPNGNATNWVETVGGATAGVGGGGGGGGGGSGNGGTKNCSGGAGGSYGSGGGGPGGSRSAATQTAGTGASGLIVVTYTAAVADAADAWISAVILAGGSVSAGRETLVRALIAGLQADGVWAKLDRLWLFAAENSQSALIDIVAAATATATNSPTHTADKGYAGNGSNAYVHSNLANNWGGGNFSQNSACFFAWNNTAGADTGALAGTALERICSIVPQYTDNNCYGSITNHSGSFDWSFTNDPAAIGLYVNNRTSASATTIDINGVEKASGSVASTALSAQPFTALLALAGGNWSSRQCSIMGLGGGLSGGERTALNTRLATYMAALGSETIPVTQAAVTFAGKTVNALNTELVPVTAAAVTFTGKTVTVGDANIIPVAKASVLFTGQTVTIRNTEVVPVLKASVIYTGKTVTVRELDLVPVLKASVVYTGKTVSVRDAEIVPVLKAAVTFAGKTVLIIDREVIPVAAASVTFAGKAVGLTETGFESIAVDPAVVIVTGKPVSIRDAEVLPVGKGTVLFTGQTVTVGDFVSTEVIPVGKGDILFAGQPISVTDTSVEPPVIQLPGGITVPPWRDLDRKKRRRYRALEEIEKRLDARIERLTAQLPKTGQAGELVPRQTLVLGQIDVLSQFVPGAQQAHFDVLSQLHEAQKRAAQVRQERVELAQLARLAAFERDEEEAITMLLLT